MIKTQRLILRSISSDSLESLVELLTDDTVKLTYMVPDFQNRTDAMALAFRLMKLSESTDRYVFGIYLGAELIGILNETEIVDGRIEVGYAILPRYHNFGFGAEALKGAMTFLFEKGFREILAGAFEENIPSIRVMQKCGMKQLKRRDEIEYRGAVHTCVYYSAVKG